MTGYIFDWKENSEKILDGEGYTTHRHQFMEQTMLCRYLIDRGYNRFEIFDLWRESRPLTVQAFENDSDEVSFIFERVWEAAQYKHIKSYKEIIIYQEEIDFINSMEIFLWMKEYLLTMLCVYKYFGTPWCRYGSKLRAFCFSVTSQKRERQESMKHIKRCLKEYSPYTISMAGTSLSFKFNFVRGSGVEAGRIKNPRYAQDLFGLLRCEKRCERCGATFEYTHRTIKKKICPVCYKIEREKKQADCRKRAREREKANSQLSVDSI